MKTVLLVFGTRPEAIKMCPLVKELQQRRDVRTVVCVTAQHRQMLDVVLRAFDVTPDYDLNIMRDRQTLAGITTSILSALDGVLEAVRPDVVLVHGDTSTTFAAGLACFYRQIPVGHVEAGLRTWNMQSPFPEEFNRQAVDLFARYLFAPTRWAADNLLREGKEPERVFITGNTEIDALKTTVRADYRHELLDWAADSRLVTVEVHRRENLGAPMAGMFAAMRRVVEETPDVKLIFPVHLNPLVQEAAHAALDGCGRIRLTDPMDVLDFHNFLARSYLIVTDSGGIQEDAAGLGRPVLVLRDTTERPEGVEAGCIRLVGNTGEATQREFRRLLQDEEAYRAMQNAPNPYGDGTASRQIADILLKQ